MKYYSLALTLSLALPVNAQRIVGENLPAYYDVATGNLTIDTTNVFEGESIGYGLQWWGTPFRPENHTPFMDTFFVTSTRGSIGEVNLDSPAPGGVYSLGNILPIGLSEQELIDQFFGPDDRGRPAGPSWTGRKYSVSAGLGDGTIHVLEPIYSPSPFPAINDESNSTPIVEKWANEVTLAYTASTGELILDTSGENGGVIWSYRLTLDQPLFDVENFTPVIDNAPTQMMKSVSDSQKIVEVGFSGIPEGTYSLGNVLPAGLNQGELSSLFATSRFIGEPGHSVASLSIDVSGTEMSLVYSVPEPGSAFLVLSSMVVFLARRSHDERRCGINMVGAATGCAAPQEQIGQVA